MYNQLVIVAKYPFRVIQVCMVAMHGLKKDGWTQKWNFLSMRNGYIVVTWLNGYIFLICFIYNWETITQIITLL